MHLDDEIRDIRRGLVGAENTLARLSRRLDEVEARQRHLDEQGAKSMPEATATPDNTPEKAAPQPPPLPTRTRAAKIATKAASAAPLDQGFGPSEPATAKPKPDTPPLLAGIPRTAAKVKKPRRFGPPEDMSFEMALGSYWLPRIGMLLVAIGTVWGFTYVAQKFEDAAWMPYARVGLGYLLSFGLVGVGRVLEKKYTNYARVLMGGGLGLLYFVTFATWYIPATRIAPSQEITLLLLGLLVAGWGALAQWRNSQPIAMTMTLLGHFTVALSTLSLASPSRAAVGGLLLLGAGSAWFLIRNGWYAVAFSAMIGSYLNQFFWLSRAPGSDLPVDFIIGMGVLAAYVVLFALAEFFTPSERRKIPTKVRTAYATLNTAGFVLLGLALVRSFPFARPHEHLLYFVTALFTLALGLAYRNRDQVDRLAATYFSKTAVLTTVGFATWLDGTTLTLSLALQSLVLLLTARYAREHSSRVLSLGAAVVTVAHGMYSFDALAFPAYGEAGYYGDVAVALSVVAICFVLAEVYRVTPWHRLPFNRYPTGSFLNTMAETLEMGPAERDGRPGNSRQWIAHGLALAGVVLYVGYGVRLLDDAGSMLWSAGGAMLIIAAVALYRASAAMLSAATLLILPALLHFARYLTESHEPSLAVLAAAGIAPLWLFSEGVGRLVPRQLSMYRQYDDIQGAWYRNHQLIATGVAALGSLLLMWGAAEVLVVERALLLAGGIAIATTAYAAFVNSPRLGLAGLLLVLFTGLYAADTSGDIAQPWMAAAGLLLAFGAATSTEQRWWVNRPGLAFYRLLPVPYAVYGAVLLGGLWLVNGTCAYEVRPLAMVGLGAAYGLLLPVLHQRAMAVFSTLAAAFAFIVWVDNGSPNPGEPLFYGTFLALGAVAIGGDRLFSRFRPFPQPVPDRTMLAVAWLTCFYVNYESSNGMWYYTFLALIAGAFLIYGAVFRTKTAVGLSLIAAFIGTIPLLLLPTLQATTGLIVLAYITTILYWLGAERGVTTVLRRTRVELLPGHQPVLFAVLTVIPALLGIVGLTRIENIQNFYLTISWTIWALALFAWAIATRQAWFRYVALATVGLATGRAFLVDVWQLEGLYRVGAMIFLGLALLSVAYGYTRWRATQLEKDAAGSAPGETGSTDTD